MKIRRGVDRWRKTMKRSKWIPLLISLAIIL
jgi:hypothetical protein